MSPKNVYTGIINWQSFKKKKKKQTPKHFFIPNTGC